MSTPLHSEYEVEADVETAFAAMSSESWAHAKAAALQDGSRVVRREEKPDGGVLLAVSRELPAGIPGFLEKLLPGDGRVTQTDDWGPAGADGTRAGQWHVDMPGTPAEIRGTMRFEPTATGSRFVVDGTAKVKVPLIGGKAEKFVAEMTGKLTAKESNVLRGMLSTT